MKKVLPGIAFVTALFTATSAFAATALVTTDLNMRTGPGTGYPVITAMPDGAIVNVRGCTSGYSWCRVDWRGRDGWASANYLAMQTGRYRGRAYSNYGAEIGIPLIAGAIIGGALLSDHDHYYHHRRYWRHHHWRGRDHDHHWRGHHRGHYVVPRSAVRPSFCPGGHRRHHGNC
jgi:uncharacterized protein YraI